MLQLRNEKPKSGIFLSSEQLLNQINYRWPFREIVEEENDGKQIIISKNLNGSLDDAEWFAKQIVAYCKNKTAGAIRIHSIQNENEIASGNHAMFFWTWRTYKENINNNVKIIFSTIGSNDPMDYYIPILINGRSGIWNKEKPFYDTLRNSIQTNSADKNVWNLACKLKELGFIEESVLPEGRQKYPKNGIRMLQDYMGLDRTEYNEQLHRLIWNEFRISIDYP